MSKELRRHKATDVSYTKLVGGSGDITRFEVTNRTIIPITEATVNIKALDVTDLEDDDIQLLERQIAEYDSYYSAVVDSIFSFEDWLSHSYGENTNNRINWRTFNIKGITTR